MLPFFCVWCPWIGDHLVGEEEVEGDDLDNALGVHEQAERYGILEGYLKAQRWQKDADQLAEPTEEHDEHQSAVV
jgi:hypothetical protein